MCLVAPRPAGLRLARIISRELRARSPVNARYPERSNFRSALRRSPRSREGPARVTKTLAPRTAEPQDPVTKDIVTPLVPTTSPERGALARAVVVGRSAAADSCRRGGRESRKHPAGQHVLELPFSERAGPCLGSPAPHSATIEIDFTLALPSLYLVHRVARECNGRPWRFPTWNNLIASASAEISEGARYGCQLSTDHG